MILTEKERDKKIQSAISTLDKLVAIAKSKVQPVATVQPEFEEKINVIYNFFKEPKEPTTQKKLSKKEKLQIEVQKKKDEIKQLSLLRLKKS